MKQKVFLTLSASIFVFIPFLAFSQETLTITTYYPSPYGSYRELQTQTLYFQENVAPSGLIAFNYPDATYDQRLRITAGLSDTGDNTQGASIDLHGNANTGRLDLVAGSNNGYISFWSGSGGGFGEKMRVAASGNVGIGTAGPNAKLAIVNNVATGFLDNYSEYQQILFDGGTAASSYGFGVKASYMVFNSNGGYSFDRTGTATSMVIDPSGYVGIGTTSPAGRLDISGGYSAGAIGASTGLAIAAGGASPDRAQIWWGDNTGWKLHFGTRAAGNFQPRVTFVDTGNVGIGSTSPGSRLHVSITQAGDVQAMRIVNTDTSSTAKASLMLGVSGSTAGDPVLQFNLPGEINWYLGADNSNNNIFTIGTSGGEAIPGAGDKLVISTDGRVGIGMAPAGRLGVDGKIYATSLTDNAIEAVGRDAVVLWVRNNTFDQNVVTITDIDGSCNQNPESGSLLTSCSSDARLKSNIRPAQPVLDYLLGIPIKDFTVLASNEEKTSAIAQEILASYPELVSMGNDGYYQVAEISSWKLIKALQELNALTRPLYSGIRVDPKFPNTSPFLHVETFGNVGIGTASPGAKLEVNGAVMASGGSANRAICWKADGKTLGYCSTAVDATGFCACN